MSHPQHTLPGQRPGVRRYVVASLVGNALEWYDFFLYATASAVVFGRLFFPSDVDPLVGTMAAFAGFAVGFAARPLGGIIFGHIGDRLGRKRALVMTLSIMGISTALMGLLPTYAQVGLWAPALLILLRVIQGIAAGGEWGGGVLLISENSSNARRGMLSAFSQGGISLGFVLSSMVFFLVQLMPDAQFLAWGWRVPFLLSVVLLAVGAYIRFRLPESKEFTAVSHSKQHRLPVLAAIKTHPREILVAMGLRVAENGGSYIFLSFSIAYGVHVGVDKGLLLMAVAVSMLVSFGTYIFFGHLSDRIGRRPVYALGAVGMGAMAFPFFSMIDSNTPAIVMFAFLLGNGLCHGAMIGTQPAFFHELFSAEVRYSAMAIAHELAAVFAGGFAPLIATALLLQYGSSIPVSLYVIGLVLVTLVALVFSRHGIKAAQKEKAGHQAQVLL
ncbi:MFS family permease [Arthrobacter sp. 1088]|uniref:MFS transporter n=1 Tax=unclassified Arthrobacter TaxID=235627 RepID=UPI001CC80350|nr:MULTISPECIES: MFS transporter [unclassified Arthrobacter]MDR6685252.1 MFS family permease [Arthrobacter sp. 1088]BCW48310.1 MFS transporter [Arthrobacter sp. StoSoilB13]